MWFEIILPLIKYCVPGIHILAKGRKAMKSGKVFQLREEESSYNINSGIKNNDIGGENSYFWNSNLDISMW